MSGFGADPRRRLLAALCLALLAPVGACSDDEPPTATSATPPEPAASSTPASRDPTTPAASEQPTITAPRNVLAEITATLDRRATALQYRDAPAFKGSVDSSDPAFAADQQQYWENMTQLPLAEVSYVLDPASVVRTDDRFEAIVDRHLELEGYDSQPALSRGRMEFVRGPDGLRIAAAQIGDDRNDGGAQPWDLGPVVVRSRPGVLGVFDTGSVAVAPAVLASVGQGVADVRKRVPASALGRGVVVYALSDLSFLQSLEGVPGNGRDEVDGLTFTVAGVEGGPAASRFVLNPTSLDDSVQARDRLVRHEVTHVATGPLGSAVPRWLGEGSAEWVSVQALQPGKRTLSRAAMNAAERGLTRLPADGAFAGDRSTASYGISWWACEYIADTYGDRAVWLLISEFQRAGAGADQGQVVQQVLGITPRRVARGAEQMIAARYAPQPTAKPSRRAGRPTPTGTPD